MRLPIPYSHINKIAEQETFESTLTWGIRMAISATAPIIWGALTGNIVQAVWISLAAEGICFMELRGSFGQGLRVLIAGAILAFIFTLLGSITGSNIWLSVLGILVVGFLSGLFKNLGDRGSNLSVSVFVVFIIANAYPTLNTRELIQRMTLVFAGGVWSIIVGMVITAIMPAQEPYRRTVGIIWKKIADLTTLIATGWDSKAPRAGLHDIYTGEKNVRTAIDSSLHYYEKMAHQADKEEYQLAQVRKATSLVAAHINAIGEELENINIRDTGAGLRLRIYDVLRSLQQVSERMAVYIITLKAEDSLLLNSRISRLQQVLEALKEYNQSDKQEHAFSIDRIAQLTERSLKLIDSSIKRLGEMGADIPVFRSYSLFKTLFILHPRHWINNLPLLFNFNTFTTKYALRTGIAAAAAMFISKWFSIDHGYWIPFTVIIVSQTYFGATIKKAVDRIIGTVSGGIAGSLLLRLHTGIWVEIILLFISFVLMIYYLRNKYSVGAFFITICLILLFNIEMPISPNLIYIRAFSTMSGALIAIVAGFMLLPHKDKKLLPVYITKAIVYNYEYFLQTVYSDNISTNWTRHKRIAESNNSNAFDSFSRYIIEPGSKKNYSTYYQVITHNVRITRELNNINIERDETYSLKDSTEKPTDTRTEICIYWFKKNLQLLQQINIANPLPVTGQHIGNKPGNLTPQQLIYLDRLIIELKSMNQDLTKLVTNHHDNEH